MAFGTRSVGGLWRMARKIEDLFTTQVAQGKALDEIQDRLHELGQRVTRLEAREEIVVAEAKGAAATAAVGAVATVVSDLARRVGGLEAQTRLIGPARPSEG